MADATGNPSTDLDAFCAQVEYHMGLTSRDAGLITEFAERLYAYFKLRGLLGATETRLLFARMAEEPRRFVPTLSGRPLPRSLS